jgi:hypothetical protein
MRKLLLLVCLFYFNWANAQTIVVGAGASTTSTSEEGDPIYNVLNNGLASSQSVQLLTANDLSSLPDFSTITSFGFFKANANTLQAGRTANVKIYMKNTTNSELVNYKNFDSWIKDAKLVYSNANFSNANLPAVAGLVSFSCNNFVYLGGSIEIYIDWTRNGAAANFATGLFTWNYDDATVVQSVGKSSNDILTNNLNCSSNFLRRYKTSLTYTAPTACTNALPGATISTTTNPVYGDSFTLSLSNYQTGTGYHWYNSAGPIANAFGETYTATANFTAETYYCRVNCSIGTIQNSTSITINPIQPISTFPFLETFDDNSPTAAAWKNTFTTAPSVSQWNSITYNSQFYISPAASSKFMYLNSFSNQAIAIESPVIQLPPTAPQYKELSYKYNINHILFVDISVNGGAFSNLYTHDSSNSLYNTAFLKPWSTNTIGLNAYDGEDIKIRFRGGTTNGLFLAVDEVSIKDSPVPCSSVPNPPTVELVSTNEAKVYFAAVAGKTYVVEYGLSGFTPGTDSGAGVGGMVLTTSVSPLLITPLQVGQTYDVYIRERCPVLGLSGTFTCSNNSGIVSFNTCQATSVPYSENFENATVPGLAACTSGVNAGSGNLWDTQNAPGFGFTSKALRYNFNFTNAANAWFFTRAINLQAGVNYVIRYKYGISDQGYEEKMKVAYGTSATVAGMSLPLTNHLNITVTGLNRVSQVFTPASNGIYYFGFNCYSDAQQDRLYVDDIVVATEDSFVPTAAATQVFCNSGTFIARVSNLVATGTALKWYATNVAVSALSPSTALVNNSTYYVSQTVDGYESIRIPVLVLINPPPTAAPNQTACLGSTLNNLVVNGTGIKWYTALTGGTLLTNTTTLAATTYYASQTTGACESSRIPVTVSFLPNNENTTNVSTCGSYTWANNNQTYTQSGIYTGTTTNCITEKLNLTINSTTWNGTAWSNGTPNTSIKAIIAGNYAQAIDLTACGLEVTGTATVTIPSGFNVTVTNGVVVTPTATLTFENNANLIQINAVSNTGDITSKRNTLINRLDYTYWSSPVSNQNLLSFTPLTLSNRFYTYNEPTKAFVQVASPAATAFDSARGYSLRAPNNFLDAPAAAQTFTGVYKGVPNNGNFTIPVTFTAGQGIGYNLIGNPYPSTVSGNAFLTANTGSMYFWTHSVLNAGVSNYAVYNLSGGTAATAGGPGVMPNGFIQTGQGFMFLTTSSKIVTFTNAMRQANNANQFFRSAATAQNDKIWLNLSNNGGAFSQTMIAYLPNTTTSFDDGYDAPQLNANGNVFSSQIADKNYAIQSRGNFAATDVVKLNINCITAGNYTISTANTEGVFSNAQVFFLKDSLLGITHNIKQSPYNFVATAGETANRFELVYETALSNNNNLFAADSVIMFEQNGMLHISATDDLKNVKVFDVQGRKIFETKDINSKSIVLKGFRPQQQVLMVQVTSLDNQVVTKKVVF